MNPPRVDIPPAAAAPDDTRERAIDIVLAAFVEAGVSPRRAHADPDVVAITSAWVAGRWTRADFVAGLRLIAAENPSLKG